MGKYTDKKVNNTPKAKKIQKELEKLGHKNVEVWYETIRNGTEMSGYEDQLLNVNSFFKKIKNFLKRFLA